jgi:ATP/ADP translocase
MAARAPAARFLDTFKLRPGELPQVALLFAWCFCVVGAVWMTRAVRDSLFLARIPADRLAYMYVASPLTMSLVGLGYSRFADNFRRERLVMGTAAIVAVALLGVRAGLGAGAWFYYVFYVAVDVMGTLAATQLWLIAGEQFNSRDAKRLIGLIAAGGTLANAVIGFGVSGVAKKAGAENLLFVCATLFGMTGVLAYLLARMHGGRLSRGRPRTIPAATPASGAVAGAGHMRLVVLIIVCSVLTVTSVDFVYKSMCARVIGADRDALVRFFGILSGVTGTLSLILQLFFTSRILTRIGVSGILMILPCSLALGATAIVFLPGLAAAAFCKSADSTLRYTLNDAGMQLLYLPVPSAVRLRAKARIDAIIKPGTESLVGVGLLAFRAVSGALVPLAAVAAVCAAAWAATAFRMRKAYVASLRATLRKRRLRLEDPLGRAAVEQALGPLAEPAAAPPPVDVEAALAELGARGSGARAVAELATQGGIEARLGAVLDGGTPAARRNAARTLEKIATPAAVALLTGALATRDETVRGAVCRGLAGAHRRNPALRVDRAATLAACRRELEAAFAALAAAEGLGRPETALKPDVAPDAPEGAAALISKALRERWERAATRLFALLDVLYPDGHIDQLARGLGDHDPVRRANATEVLEATLDRALRTPVVALVDDSPRYVKLAAVAGVVDVPRRTREGWLRALLADDSAWLVACAAFYAGAHELVALGPELVPLLGHPSPIVRESSLAALAHLLPASEIRPLAQRALADEFAPQRKRAEGLLA